MATHKKSPPVEAGFCFLLCLFYKPKAAHKNTTRTKAAAAASVHRPNKRIVSNRAICLFNLSQAVLFAWCSFMSATSFSRNAPEAKGDVLRIAGA